MEQTSFFRGRGRLSLFLGTSFLGTLLLVGCLGLLAYSILQSPSTGEFLYGRGQRLLKDFWGLELKAISYKIKALEHWEFTHLHLEKKPSQPGENHFQLKVPRLLLSLETSLFPPGLKIRQLKLEKPQFRGSFF